MRTILIRGARQLLTLRGNDGRPRRGESLSELGIIPDGAVLIHDGVLVEVGPSRRLENLAKARRAVEISAAGRVVMPGFVDSHTHLVFPPPGGGAANGTDAVRRLRAGTGQRLEGRVRGWLDAMARHGTTTVEVKTGCAPDLSAEVKLLRVLADFARDPIEAVPTVLLRLPGAASDELAAVADWTVRELLPVVRRRGLAQFLDVAWRETPGEDATLRKCLEAARSMGIACKIHAEGRGAAAVAAAADHLVVSVDHLDGLRPAEVAPLAGVPTIATLLPAPAWRAGGPFAPARALIQSGAALALASNFNPHHTPAPSMQTAIALAHLHMGMTAEETIAAATINGAHALGAASRIGSLEPGKSADLLMLDTSDYRDLAHQFGANLVQFTMKRGNIIYRQGEVGPRAGPDAPERLEEGWDDRDAEAHGTGDRQHLRNGIRH